MKQTYIHIIAILFMVFGVFVTTGCEEDFEYTKDYSVYDGVTLGINMVDENNVLNLNFGNSTYKVAVNVMPADIRINSQEYLYKVADEAIATIDDNGFLTMKGEGETKLTVTLAANPEINTSCTVKVKPVLINKLHVPAEITLKQTSTMGLVEQISVTPTIANCVCTYSVADENVATVTEEGIITAVSGGSTTISVSTTDGSNLTETINLTVEPKKLITAIELPITKVNGKSFLIGQGLNLAKYTTIAPADADEPVVEYSVKSGTDFVEVSADGIITCKATGNAVILATAKDGGNVSAEIPIEVGSATGWLERVLFTVDTSARYSNGLNYQADGTRGKPEMLIDGDDNTWLSLFKPEKEKPGNADDEISFTIDMGAPTAFNKVKYRHRSLNNLLAASKIQISGSNDGKDFTIIKNEADVNFNTAYTHEIELSDQSYRYIKVKSTEWVKWTGASGSALQVAEFNIGNFLQP